MGDQSQTIAQADTKLASFGGTPLGFVKSEVDDTGLVEGEGDLAREIEAAHTHTVCRYLS